MNGIILAVALSAFQVGDMLEDCHMAGLEYGAVTSISLPNTKTSTLNRDAMDRDGLFELWDRRSIEAAQLEKSIQHGGVFVYEQWCEVKQPGKHTLFKPVMSHQAVMTKLAECRAEKDIAVYRPNVLILALQLMYTPAKSYANIRTGWWSNEPTSIECKL